MVLLIPVLEAYFPHAIALLIQSYGVVNRILIHRDCLRRSDQNSTEECKHSVWINGSKDSNQLYSSQIYIFLKDNRGVRSYQTPFAYQIGKLREHLKTSFYFHHGTLDPSWLESIQFIQIDCICLQSYPCKHEIRVELFPDATDPGIPRMANAILLLAIVSKMPERVNVPTPDNPRLGWQVADVRRHLLLEF